jgi:hypothetical protein
MRETIHVRTAAFEPSTYNPERRTVQVVFSTGADVMRSDFEGPYIERLSLEPGAVDLSQLIGGPVLDNHDRFTSVRAVLGVVTDASVDGKRGVATVQFSERPEVQGIARDVEQGIIRAVSAGYTVSKWEVSKRADGTRIKTAVSWAPKEISFTPLAADPAARTRSNEVNMNEELQNQIRGIAAAVGVQTAFADDLIQRNVSLDDARTAIIREAARAVPAIDNRAPDAATRNGGDNLILRMADGLYSRMNPAHTPEAGREFAYARISDIARRCLEHRGLSTLGSPADLITRAMHTPSDFSAVLAEVYNKSLLQLRSAPSAIQQLFRRATVADFRARHVMEISDGPALSLVGETGEVTFGTISDKELASYAVKSYARGFAISFQALVNDNVQALSDISETMARGARAWFAGFLANVVMANPKLADGKAVFHADHKNLAASGAAPSDTTIGAGKLAMRLQTDASGNPIDAPARFIVIPAALETAVDKLLSTLYPQTSADAEISARGLIPVVIPQFDQAGKTKAWYLFASPSDAPVFEYAELSGYEGPRVETRQGFETLGTEVRVAWHLGAGAIDSRGAYLNAGE